MTLPSRHRIQKSSPGGLRPSTIPLGRGGSPQYLRLMTPRSLESKFHHVRTFCNLPAKVGDLLSCFWFVTYGARAFHIWRRARRLWRSRLIFVGGGGQGIQCRRFFAMDVVPVQLTIYSLSRLIRKISDLYPSSHFLWHHFPPVPHLVQEYWGFFNAGTLPFPHGKEIVSHCDRPWHFLSAQWQHGVNIKHWSVPLPHIFHQISTCSLPRLCQPHCDVQDSFLFPPCWCCVHDWNCR